MIIARELSEIPYVEIATELRGKFCIGYGPRESIKEKCFSVYLDTGGDMILIDTT